MRWNQKQYNMTYHTEFDGNPQVVDFHSSGHLGGEAFIPLFHSRETVKEIKKKSQR